MDINILLIKIINLPQHFHEARNKSISELLFEIGYFEYYKIISESDIVKILDEHPDKIEDWVQWSEGKRSSSGWYLNARNGKPYNVGFYPPDEKHVDLEYLDLQRACAAFIKREIEDIRLK